MSTLVTCATGFVAQAFLRALRDEGDSASVLIRDGSRSSQFPRETVFVGDVFDPSCVGPALEGAETVIHVPPLVNGRGDAKSQLAAHRRSHVESARIVLEEAVSRGVRRFLMVSSAHATGRSTDSVLCECSGGSPHGPYARAKLEAEEVAFSYAERHPIDVVIVRPTEIYGPGDKSVISSLRRAAQLNLWLPLAGLDSLHSLVFVDNLARAGLELLKRTAELLPPRVYIVTDPVDYRPADLYAAVCRGMGKRPMLFKAPLPLVRSLGYAGSTLFRGVPKLRWLGLLRYLMTPQRYCGHLFNERVPDFRFVALDDAVLETFGTGARPPQTR